MLIPKIHKIEYNFFQIFKTFTFEAMTQNRKQGPFCFHSGEIGLNMKNKEYNMSYTSRPIPLNGRFITQITHRRNDAGYEFGTNMKNINMKVYLLLKELI